MGTGVLNVSSTNSSSGGIRSYAHCSQMGATSVTLVLINLDKTDWPNVTVKVGQAGSEALTRLLPMSVPAMRWLLTGPRGTNSSFVSLNGKILALDADSHIPPLPASKELFTSSSNTLLIPHVPAESVQFIVLDGLGSLVGCC
jgi:hypothetical protein